MLAVLAAGLWALMSVAYGDGDSARPAVAASRPAILDAEALLHQGVGQLLELLDEVRLGQRSLGDVSTLAFLEREIAPYFDFAYMSKWAAGPAYRRLNAPQRAALEDKIKRLFFHTLAHNLKGQQRPEIRYFAPRPSRDGREVRLAVWVMESRAPPIKLSFRFYLSPGGWKVFDVVANRNSAVLYYRGLIRRGLRRHGLAWLER